MSKIEIVESGLTFKFDHKNAFLIEKEVKNGKRFEGIKKVDIIVKNKDSVCFIEAKSSIPIEADDYFEEIKQKMIHSLTVWVNIVLKRISEIALPSCLDSVEDLKEFFKFILIVNGMPDEYMEPATLKFKKILEIERKLWGIKYEHIFVLNDKKAKELKLVS
jgi:hypothetical protein